MEPQIDPVKQAIQAKIAELERQQDEAKKRGPDELASKIAYGVQYCKICHKRRTPNHKDVCPGPCKNWSVDDDGKYIDVCGYPNEERKRKGHEDRAFGHEAKKWKKRLERKESKSLERNANSQVSCIIL